MDVVEKVQNVLKSAMGKPSTLTGSVSTIPEKASAEWSNILPAILAGDKYGDKEADGNYHMDAATSKPQLASTVFDSSKFNKTEMVPMNTFESVQQKEEVVHQVDEKETQKAPAAVTVESTTSSYTEKIMIPVPVITAEQKPQTTQRVSMSTQSPVFQKITEMLPLGSAVGNYNQEGKKNASLVNVDLRTSTLSSTSESTKNSYASTEAVSVTVQSATEDSVKHSEMEAKTESTMMDVSSEKEKESTSRPILADDSQTKASTLEMNKVETSVMNVPTTLSSYSTYSPTVSIMSTNEATKISLSESSTTASDAVAKPSDTEFTTPMSKPLSAELVDSLSSMINQVSDVSVPSFLGVSSGFELPLRDMIEKSKNGSVTRVDTGSTVSVDLPTIIHDEPMNMVDALKEDVGVSTETVMELQTDQERVPATTLSTVTSAGTSAGTGVGETTKYQDNSVKNVTQSTLNSELIADAIENSNQEVLNATSLSSSAVSDQTSSAIVSSTEETMTTLNSLELLTTNLTVANSNSSLKINGEENSNMNLIAMVDSMLQTASTEANSPITQSVSLPNVSLENLPPKTIGSGLIAGFGSTDSQRTEEVLRTTASVLEPSPTESTLKLETQGSTSATPIVTETLKINDASNTEEGTLKKENEIQSTQSMVSMVTEKQPLQSTDSLKETTVDTTDRTVSVTSTSIEKTQLQESSSIPSIAPDVTTRSTVTDRTDLTSTQEATVEPKESSQVPEQEKVNVGSTEVVTPENVTRIERIPEEALKKDDKTSVANSNDFASASSTERVEEKITEELTTPLANENRPNVTTPSSVDQNATGSSKESLQSRRNETIVSDTKEEILHTTDTNGTKLSTITAEKISTTTVKTVAPKIEITSSSNVETTVSTSSPIVESNIDKTVANEVNASSSVIYDFRSKNATVKPQNESQESAVQKPSESAVTESLNQSNKSQINQTSDSVNSAASKLNSTSDVDSEYKWQRVPLRQTTPSSATKLVASSKKPAETVGSTLSISASTQEGPYQETSTPSPNETPTVSLTASKSEVSGLDASTRNASTDVVNFSRFCNELAFKYWVATNKGLSTGRSLALSPFGMVSLLSMIFLGARGPTSDQMNEVLGLDNVATFNPHLIFQNVTDTVSLARHQGIANAAFVRELFADKTKVRKLLPFYKEQAQQFYEGLVAEVNFATISDLARRRTNLLIRKQTGGRIKDFVKSNAVPLRSPLAAISANVFQTDCNTSSASTAGRDGELYFAVSSVHRLRKLIPVPAAVWRTNVLAGYEPSLDATVIALGGIGKLVSTIFLLPGQQGHMAPGDTLDRLEQRLVKGASRGDGSWNKLLRVLIPRPGLELQIPKFSHRSVVNATAALKRMGLDQLFTSDADLKGINGIGNRLYLSDVLQVIIIKLLTTKLGK